MADQKLVRRLAAIFVADAVSYCRLMGTDEVGTYTQFKADVGSVLGPRISAHGGRIIKTTGDGLLAEFASVVDAVRCADEIQRTVDRRNADLPEDGRLAYRIGINLGDIIVEGDDIYGDDVNIAVRVEGLAEPGGITLAADAYRSVRKKLRLAFEDLGEHRLKNIAEPVQVFRVMPDSKETERPAVPQEGRPFPSRDARPTPASRNGGLARYLPYKPAIVVLPFKNLSGDAAQEYFCDGLTEDITTDLSKFTNLFVISAHSAFAYKGRRVEAGEVSQELGVRYLLEGSVQRSVDRLRINAQLVDAATGRYLWAERFDRELRDIFEVQDEIIRMIVTALAVKVEAVERERAMRKETDNINAYDAFLKGAHLHALHLEYSNETDEWLKKSRGWFEKATELDPQYARAWGWLSYSYVTSWLEGWAEEAALGLAEEYAKKAVALDAFDYDNHYALGFFYSSTGRFDQALDEYNKALRLNANDAHLLAEMAETLSYMGEHQKSVEQIKRAMRLNPHFPEWYRWELGWAYYHAREYEGSLAELQRINRPNNKVWLITAADYAQMSAMLSARDDESAEGYLVKARHALAVFLERRPDWTVSKEMKAVSFRNKDDADHWLNGLRLAGLPEG